MIKDDIFSLEIVYKILSVVSSVSIFLQPILFFEWDHY